MRAKYGHCAKTKRGGHCTEMAVNGGSTALCKKVKSSHHFLTFSPGDSDI